MLVTSTIVSGELLVSSVHVFEVSALVVGLPVSVELSLGVEGKVWVVRVELSDGRMGCAVSVELSLWISVDEVGRGNVT